MAAFILKDVKNCNLGCQGYELAIHNTRGEIGQIHVFAPFATVLAQKSCDAMRL